MGETGGWEEFSMIFPGENMGKSTGNYPFLPFFSCVFSGNNLSIS
jgi:hypothetical protein